MDHRAIRFCWPCEPGLAVPLAARARGAPLLADVLEMAGPCRGPWDLMLPEARERRLGLEHLARGATPSWCHHSLSEVAELGGRASAALVAFEPGELGDASLAKPVFEIFQLLGWSSARIAAVGPLLAPYLRCFPPMPPGVWIVENVGTRADLRRRGLVGALLERALDRGRERGFAIAQISCLIGNDAAQRAYEGGFAVVEQRVDPSSRGCLAPGFSRMTRTL
jgi:ribosomal protein S18 acetylase RimI-like enzyme